jgi:hypothetical protein
MASPEYRLRFSDRVQKHFFNGGVLTPERTGAIYAERMQRIDRAIVGESARWGDNQREPAYTRADWLATQNSLLTSYFPNRSRVVLNQFSARGWLVPLLAPVFSQFGGTVRPSFQLALSKPGFSPEGAQIYYTLDGSDPRDANTALPRGSAILYSGPIVLNAGAQVKARVFYEENLGSGSDWSAIVDATFLLDVPFPLRIAELHYNPAPRSGVADEQDLEFIELVNTGTQPVSLAGVSIAQFASEPYTFGGGVDLAAGERMIVARSPSVARSVYGAGIRVAPVGYGPANLSNSGERIALLGPLGETIQDFVYDDTAPWPIAADGDGRSLEIVDALGDARNAANWRASSQNGGSPGTAGGSNPGDYDGNALVDEADRLRWQASFGLPVAAGTGADGNGDGMVNAADYIVWRNALVALENASGASAATTSATLPSESSTSGVPLSSGLNSEIPVESMRASRPQRRPMSRPVFTASPVDGTDLLVLIKGASVDVALAEITQSRSHIPAVRITSGPSLAAEEFAALEFAGLDSAWDDLNWLDHLG